MILSSHFLLLSYIKEVFNNGIARHPQKSILFAGADHFGLLLRSLHAAQITLNYFFRHS